MFIFASAIGTENLNHHRKKCNNLHTVTDEYLLETPEYRRGCIEEPLIDIVPVGNFQISIFQIIIGTENSLFRSSLNGRSKSRKF